MHCCCAPCASAVIERLSAYALTLLFYNPNIDTADEYRRRADELVRLSRETVNAEVIVPPFDPRPFYEAATGLETCPEGGDRCRACIGTRLRYTAEKSGGYDFFTTTLSVSPHKNSRMINELGENLSAPARWLYSDFKKKDGYKRSIELSKAHGLYRQNYCGCRFAKNL